MSARLRRHKHTVFNQSNKKLCSLEGNQDVGKHIQQGKGTDEVNRQHRSEQEKAMIRKSLKLRTKSNWLTDTKEHRLNIPGTAGNRQQVTPLRTERRDEQHKTHNLMTWTRHDMREVL